MMRNVPMKVAIADSFSAFCCESSSARGQVLSSEIGLRGPPGLLHKEMGNLTPPGRFCKETPPGRFCKDRGGHRSYGGSLFSELNIRPPPGLDMESESLPGTASVCGSSDYSGFASESEGSSPRDWRDMRECRTTLHLRNLPCYFTRGTFLGLLDAKGFAGQYDYVYLPMDFQTHQSIGYAFVNFRSSTAALLFRAAMHGFSKWPIHSYKVCSVQWSQTQGYQANVELVRCSGVMNKEGVSDENRPVVFINGQMTPLLPFPQRRRGRTERMH